MAINNIFPFAQSAVPPAILDDADYEASSVLTTGYISGSIADAPTMSKAQRQTSAICAGLGEWLANYQATDVEDDLPPSTLAAMINAALGGAPGTTQVQFDDSTAIATDEFVQRALGSLSSSVSYGVNTNLTAADIGKVVIPSSGGLAFGLPLVSSLPDGAQIRFNGNSHGCAISRQGSDVINNGTAGAITTISVLEYDVVEFTVIGGVWTVTDGNEQLNTSTQFENSLITNGYIKLPGGFIMNFNTLGINSNATWTYAQPFSTITLGLFGLVTAGGSPQTVILSGDGISLSQAKYYAETPLGGGATVQAFVFAIGK